MHVLNLYNCQTTVTAKSLTLLIGETRQLRRSWRSLKYQLVAEPKASRYFHLLQVIIKKDGSSVSSRVLILIQSVFGRHQNM